MQGPTLLAHSRYYGRLETTWAFKVIISAASYTVLLEIWLRRPAASASAITTCSLDFFASGSVSLSFGGPGGWRPAPEFSCSLGTLAEALDLARPAPRVELFGHVCYVSIGDVCLDKGMVPCIPALIPCMYLGISSTLMFLLDAILVSTMTAAASRKERVKMQWSWVSISSFSPEKAKVTLTGQGEGEK